MVDKQPLESMISPILEPNPKQKEPSDRVAFQTTNCIGCGFGTLVENPDVNPSAKCDLSFSAMGQAS